MSQRQKRLIITAMFAGILCVASLASAAENTITNPVAPNGHDPWIIHAAKHRGGKWDRNARMQPFTWDRQGNPRFDRPVDEGVAIPSPAED
jgi:GH43 family beta-xylosidase